MNTKFEFWTELNLTLWANYVDFLAENKANFIHFVMSKSFSKTSRWLLEKKSYHCEFIFTKLYEIN